MERHFFTTGQDCPFNCQYCFEIFNNYKFPVICYNEVRNLNNCFIYPTFNTEFFLNEQLLSFFNEYIKKSNAFNIFSFSTKSSIDEKDFLKLIEINKSLRIKEIGDIKISVSLTHKYNIDDNLEEGTASYQERLSLAKKLQKNNIKTAVNIKPILPFVKLEEYKEIINDFISNDIRYFVTGDLYFSKNTDFYNQYIKDYNNIIQKSVMWLKSNPVWTQIVSKKKIGELAMYIKSLSGYHFESDEDLLKAMFLIKE